MNVKENIKEVFEVACDFARFQKPVGIDDRDDFVQNVMMRALTKELKDNWRGYVYVTLKSVVSDAVRKNKRVLSFDYPLCEGGDWKVLEDAIDPRSLQEREIDLMPRLKNVLAKLSPPLRAVLVLYSDGYSYEEIASMTKVSIGTVRTRLHHARKRAKKMLIDIV